MLATAALALASCVSGGAAMPAAYAHRIEEAQLSLADHDDLPFSSYLFSRIRCRQDGGLLVEFERWSLLGRAGIGFEMQGPNDTGWGGGIAGEPLDPGHREIEFFFQQSPEVACARN